MTTFPLSVISAKNRYDRNRCSDPAGTSRNAQNNARGMFTPANIFGAAHFDGLRRNRYLLPTQVVVRLATAPDHHAVVSRDVRADEVGSGCEVHGRK
jgi:hypothetical protein